MQGNSDVTLHNLIRIISHKSVFFSLSSEKETGVIHVYDGRGSSTALHTLNLHTKPVTFIKVFTHA